MKLSISLPDPMAREVRRYAKESERSISWWLQKAWQVARLQLMDTGERENFAPTPATIAASSSIQLCLRELNAGLTIIYQSQFAGAYLYGSYARGDERPGSDLDILIILMEVGDYAAEIARTSELISRLSLKYGVSISRVFISRDEWIKGQKPFLNNIREEAMPV